MPRRFDASRIKNLGNASADRGAVSQADAWEEVVVVHIPKAADGVQTDDEAFIKVQFYRANSMNNDGFIWVDDISIREIPDPSQPLPFLEPPATKNSFDGSYVRIDQLGNVDVKRNGIWKPFFPLCMYGLMPLADNIRYSEQGWNCNMWKGSSSTQLTNIRDAISDFNPDGMMAGFSIAGYTNTGGIYEGDYYNDFALLTTRIEEIKYAIPTLFDRILWYYWDNENSWTEWDRPMAVLETIADLDVDADGIRQHPLYMLEGVYTSAKIYNGITHAAGTYAGGINGMTKLAILNQTQNQETPTVVGQINGITGLLEFRMIVYLNLIAGVRSIGYYRDEDELINVYYGPVDDMAWWPDFPNIRREIDAMILLLRQPHWTKWSVSTSDPNVIIGSRDFDIKGHLLLVNIDLVNAVTATLTLNNLYYEALIATDFFTATAITPIDAITQAFTITLNPGETKVIRLDPQ